MYVQGDKYVCDVLSRVASMYVQGNKYVCDVLSRVANMYVMFCPGR